MSQAKLRSNSPRLPAIAAAKLRLIHVARRQLGLSEDDYRSILGLFGGAVSATDLDQAGFTGVMARFEQLGFRSTSTRRPLPVRAGMATPGQISLIRHLWAECTDASGTDASLGKWLERQFRISSIRFVTAELAPKVVGGLKSMKAKLRRSATS